MLSEEEDMEYGGDGGSSSFYDEYNMLNEVQGDQSNTMTPLANRYHNLEDLEYGGNSGSSSLCAYEDNMLSEEKGDRSNTDVVPMEQSDMGQCSYSYLQEMAMSTIDASAMLYLDGSEEDLDFLMQLSMIYENDHCLGQDDALVL